MRARDARGLVMPAHTLKSEARQFGAEKLGALAEDIEMFARRCVESQVSPEEYHPRVVELRPLFDTQRSALEREDKRLLGSRPIHRSAPAYDPRPLACGVDNQPVDHPPPKGAR